MQILETVYMVDNKVTVCVLITEVDGAIKNFLGTAVRHPTDPKNAEFGRELAQSRAVGKLSRHIERRMNGFLRQQDDIVSARANAEENAKRYAEYLKRTTVAQPDGSTVTPSEPAETTSRRFNLSRRTDAVASV